MGSRQPGSVERGDRIYGFRFITRWRRPIIRILNVDKHLMLFLYAFILCPAVLPAHPHMFLSSTAEFVWKETGLEGCYLEWTFDRFFSSDIIQGYDRDMNGKFNAAETGEIYSNAFINLKNYYYFTFIRQGNKRTNPPEVTRFTVSLTGEKVSYRFFIDLSGTAPGDLSLAVYDYTFFCDISYPPANAVKLDYDPALVSPSYTIAENREFPVYYNPLGAVDDNTIYYTWKKGLQTYYPREIRITYAK